MKIRFLKKVPKDKLQKMVLIGIVALSAVVGVIQFYVLRNWSELADTQSRITKLEDQIRQTERTARNAKQDVAYRADVKSFVETQRAAMVSGDPFAWVVREISLLAEKHPVHINALHPDSKSESGGQSKNPTYATGIDFSGTYDEIGEFVRDLENQFPTAEILSLSLAGNPDDKGQHGASLSIVLRAQPPEPSKKTEAKRKS